MNKVVIDTRTANFFNEGDILVVPSSSFLTTPAFFKVAENMAYNIRLTALGIQPAKEVGKYIPDVANIQYDSICSTARARLSRFAENETSYVDTWCGKALLWDGKAC